MDTDLDIPEFSPLLTRTLSEQHWCVALHEMKRKNSNIEKAGHYGSWTYQIVRSLDDRTRAGLQTIYNGILVLTKYVNLYDDYTIK